MTEKTILITGSSDGIGKATALELARHGDRVIVHGRNAERIQQAIEEIRRVVPNAHLESALADLSSQEQVRALAQDIAARFDHLDVLIHNAGVFLSERQLSVDGYEMTLAVNHFAPFLLTNQLLPMLRSSHTRVITVASVVHKRGEINFNDLNAEQRYDGYVAYAQSKLANIFFANELADRERGNLTSNSLHPGVIGTKLLKVGFSATGATTKQGAATSVHLAITPGLENVTARYFDDCKEARIASHAQDLAVQKRLWEISEQCTA